MVQDRDIPAATLRFIAGAIFGALAGFWLVVAVNTPVLFFGGIITSASVGGLISMRFGLRFWEMLRHFRWFPF